MHFQLPFGGRAKLTTEALSAMDRYRQHGAADPEGGGFLLGRIIRDSRDVVVDEVTEPGPGDERTRFGFHLCDLVHHQIAVDTAWERSEHTCCFLGDWHTHAEPDPQPSRVDLDGWRSRLASDASDEFPLLVFVIVGTERVRAWQGDRRTMQIREAVSLDAGGATAFDTVVALAFDEHRSLGLAP